MAETSNWNELVARYRNEMRRLYEKSERPLAGSDTPPIAAEVTEAEVAEQTAPSEEGEATAPNEEGEAAAPSEEGEATAPSEEGEAAAPSGFFDSAPPFGDGAEGTAQSQADLEGVRVPPESETDVGTLVVYLNSARGTIPIVGATVSVYRRAEGGDTLLYMGETNESGESPVWTLSTKDRTLSLEPGIAVPYVNYAVQANAEGYITFRSEGVSVFGGVRTVQRITMEPLPEPAAVTEPFLETRAENQPPELN